MQIYDNLIINKYDYKQIVGKTTIMIGASQTGKSHLMRDMLYNIKDLIPVCLVICPTEIQNEGYKGIVPDVAIIKTVTRDRLIQKLTKLYQRQEYVTKLYNAANDTNKLRQIVQQIGQSNQKIDTIENLYEQCKKKLQDLKLQLQGNSDDQSLIQKIDKLNEQNKILKIKLRAQYKKAISRYNDKQDPKLTQEQKSIVNNLHINPNMLLVLDDIAANLDTQLQKSELFRKFFFQGRHNNISLLIAVQDDKKLIPEIRQNGFNLVFTDSSSLSSYIKSNNGNMQSVKQIIQTLNTYKEDFIKVLYSREQNQYHYVKARLYPDFRFGSDKFWEFCEQSTKNK